MKRTTTLPIALIGMMVLALTIAVIAQTETRKELPLVEAARTGDTDKVRALLVSGEIPDVRGSAGYTPLMLACAAGGSAMTELLLPYRADPNLSTENGLTALAIASGAIAPESFVQAAVGKLLDSGANPNPNSPVSPLAFAMLRSHAAAVNSAAGRWLQLDYTKRILLTAIQIRT